MDTRVKPAYDGVVCYHTTTLSRFAARVMPV